MKSQDRENEYRRKILGGFGEEWTTANRKERVELSRRISRWQELVDNGWTATKAYFKVMEELQETPPNYPFWTKMRKALVVIPVLALAAAIVYGTVITGEIDTLKTELESVQSTLASTQTQLSSTKQTLTSIQSELDSTQSDLKVTQADLTSTKSELVSTQTELSSTTQTLASIQSELSSTQDTLASTQTELSSTQDTLASTQTELQTTRVTLTSVQNNLVTVQADLKLYRDTLGVEVLPYMQDKISKGGIVFPREYVSLTDNPYATNPTWSRLMSFLYSDPTDDEYYNLLTFNCTNFAERLHNNAEAAGIKAAFVALYFKDQDTGHALNAFTTRDKGLVYVDCTGGDGSERFRQQIYGYTVEYDSIVYVWKGDDYLRWSIDNYGFRDYHYYEPYRSTSDWEPAGVVESIKIYW